MSELILTKLDENGNLTEAGKENLKVLKIIKLSDNPFLWSDKIKIYTNNLDEKFVRKFLKDNDLDFDKLKTITGWFPFYYVAFLLETAESIKVFGIRKVKDEMLKFFRETNVLSEPLRKLVNSISNDLNKDTRVGIISGEFNTFTNIDFMMICIV